MRFGALLLCVLVLAGVRAAPALAVEPTTRDAADCLGSSDRPVCLLRVLAQGDTHFPYRTREEFANAQQILTQIGEVDSAMERRIAASTDTYDRIAIGPALERARLVADAVTADRGGQEPALSLAPILDLSQGLRSRSLLLGQIVTESGVDLRSGAYEAIVSRYLDPAGPASNKPSLALVQAALVAWEREISASPAAVTNGDPQQMAYRLSAAYGRLDDRPAAERAARLAGGPKVAVELRALLAGGRLEEAVTLAVQAELPAPGRQAVEEEWFHGDEARQAVHQAALDAGRPALALRVAEASLAQHLVQGRRVRATCYPYCEARPPLFVVLDNAPRETALAWAERLDAAGRTTTSIASPAAAVAAATAWVRLGEPQRVESLIAAWRARALAQAGKSCGGPGADFCVVADYARLLMLSGKVDEAFSLPGWTPREALDLDLQTGRGLERLDLSLTKARQPYERTMALQLCAERAGWRRRGLPPIEVRLNEAKTCVAKLFEMTVADRTRPNGSKVEGGKLVTTFSDSAADTAATLASAAAGAGDLALMRRMLELALTAWRDAPAQPIDVVVRFALDRVAVADLLAAGRL